MKHSQKLEALFNDMTDISPEKMEALVRESVIAFEEIIKQLQSDDEKQRDEAHKTAEKLRDTLEKQSIKALEAISMDAEELEAFTNNPENFSPEEWEALQKAKKDMASFQQEMTKKGVLPNGEPVKTNKKKKKAPWIVS